MLYDCPYFMTLESYWLNNSLYYNASIVIYNRRPWLRLDQVNYVFVKIQMLPKFIKNAF